jgi:hypothetical protein
MVGTLGPVAALGKGQVVALLAIVHGSMAGPGAYTRLATELDHRSQRVLLIELPVDRPELTDYARLVPGQLDAALTEHGTEREPLVVVARSASGLLLPLVPSLHPVTQLVYLAGGVPQPGMTLDEQLEDDPDMLNPAETGCTPGDRATRWPLPPRVPPGAPGRDPDIGYGIPLRMARTCASSFGRSFCATDQTRSTSMSK